jgi:hypothetical protein
VSGGLARPGLSGAENPGSQRVRLAHVEWVAERLSERDWAVIETVNLLRLMRGDQVERLFFSHLYGRSRVVSRGRMLKRLVAWRVLDVLPRRIGGSLRGSAGSIYALGSAGQRLLAQRQGLAGQAVRVRHAGGTTDRTLKHTLMVSELYASLVELAPANNAKLVAFAAEPACWWPDGFGSYVKPDAYLALDGVHGRDHWWVEADLATESLPTIRRKLLTHLSFLERGQLGPGGVVPRVLVVTITPGRQAAIREVIEHLPEPAGQMFGVTSEPESVPYFFSVLRE